jgi:hypothetical protein
MHFVKYFIILKIEAYSETINHQMTNIGFLCWVISKRIRLNGAKEWTKVLKLMPAAGDCLNKMSLKHFIKREWENAT